MVALRRVETGEDIDMFLELRRAIDPEHMPPPTAYREHVKTPGRADLLAFLDAMGVSLLPPAPASVPLTFALTPGGGPRLVPARTQAGSRATPERPAALFETDDDLTVLPARPWCFPGMRRTRNVSPPWTSGPRP